MLRLQEAVAIFLAAMAGGVKAPTTIEFYRKHLPSLILFLGDVPIDAVTISGLRAWRAYLAERKTLYKNRQSKPGKADRLSPYTVHQYIRCARYFFKWLHREGLAALNPADRLELPALPNPHPRGIPLEDLERLLAVATNTRDRAIVLFLGDTAARVGGVAGLTMKNLYLADGEAVIHEKGRGGQQKIRTVFFGQRTKEALAAYLEERPLYPGAHFVFLGTNRNKKTRKYQPRGLTTNGIYLMLRRLAKLAGVEDNYNPHSFRHGSIRGMLGNGMSLPEASQIAGHSSVQVTGDIYGIVPESQLRRHHNQFSWLQ